MSQSQHVDQPTVSQRHSIIYICKSIRVIYTALCVLRCMCSGSLTLHLTYSPAHASEYVAYDVQDIVLKELILNNSWL
jgi:hypothetical protein